MEHIVDSKRQFLSNKIKLKRLSKQVYFKRVKKILRKSEPQFREKLRKLRLRKKVVFL